jgi:hypothetical protein
MQPLRRRYCVPKDLSPRTATPPLPMCCASFVPPLCEPLKFVSRRRRATRRKSTQFRVQFTDEPAVTSIVWLFSFVLGFSRPIWARFVLHQEIQTVLRCHSSSWRVNAKSPVAFRQPSAGGYPGVRKSFTCAAVGWPQASQRGPLVRFFTADGKTTGRRSAWCHFPTRLARLIRGRGING